MLLKFKVSNYGSICDLQEFSMLCGSTRTKPDHIAEVENIRVLKNTVMYGPNAAGKSKFISAIETSQAIILSSMTSQPDIRKSYCRVNPENRKAESYFEYIFSVGKRFYSYGFEAVLNDLRIDSEWLIELDTQLQEKNLVFQREYGGNFEFGDVFDKDARTRLDIYASDMQNMQANTFLYEMNLKNLDGSESLEVFRRIYSWFRNKLYVNHVKMPDKKSLYAAENVLKGLGLGITGIGFREMSGEQVPFLSTAEYTGKTMNAGESTPDWAFFESVGDVTKAYELRIMHGNNIPFGIEEESASTLDVLRMVPLLTDEEDDVTVILDDYGDGLHPKLAYRFTELIQRHNSRSTRQFIACTHETALMTLELFRRDEIWFMEKMGGISTMYSLEEFRERFDKVLQKAYLEGRYGALPVFSE